MDAVVKCNYSGNCYFKNGSSNCLNKRYCKDKGRTPMDVLHESMRENDQVLRTLSHGSRSSPYKPLRVENIVKSDMSAGMTAGVYYATYGHWTISLLQAGYDVQWHVQPNIKNFNLKDAFANNILLNNFPEIPIPSAKEFDRTGGLDDGVDIICGSPPCIGFSQGNPTSGADHPANKNFINMFEFIAYYRPKYYLVEIVPRILKPGVGREIMLKAMDKVEMYKTRKVCEFKIENYGCPARRDRCYFFGSLEDISFDPLWEFESIFSAGKPTGKSVNILGKPEYEKFKGVMELEGEIVSRYDCSGKLRTGPFRSALKASRILMPDEPAYTITGMAYCNMKHWDRDSASGLNRFLAVSEIADLMGMPADYEYLVDNLHRKNKVDIKCNIIASGVDTRFTTKLLKFIAGRIRGGT